jgi:hypothetical protein
MIQVKMTPQQAQSFNMVSKNSVSTILAQRTCNCDPYTDWFTFKRWIAQGQCVNKGAHGIKLLIYTPSEALEDDGKTVVINKKFYSSWVFCRCQVHPLNEKPAKAPAPAVDRLIEIAPDVIITPINHAQDALFNIEAPTFGDLQAVHA